MLSDPSHIGKAACELVEEYDERIKKIGDIMKNNLEEYEELKLKHSELRSKYTRAINAVKTLQEENAKLKKALKEQKAVE